MLILLVTQKKIAQGMVLVGFLLRFGLIDLFMECIPDTEQWRINSAFIMLFALVGASFCSSKI